MKRQIEFIGGPMCGRRVRVPGSDICQYVGVVLGRREYLYKFAFRHGTHGKQPVKVGRRYVFCGHKAKLPGVK